MNHLPYIGLIDPFKPHTSALRLLFVIYLQTDNILVEPQLDIATTTTARRSDRGADFDSTLRCMVVQDDAESPAH